jgi:hydroxylaminobenzene mutase
MGSSVPYPFCYEVKRMNKDRFIKTIQENMLSRQGHRLLQVGVALFLFVSLEGFAIPYLASPRLGLSVHTLSALQGVLLLALGLVWPRLNLGATTSRIAFWLLIYSAFAILAAYVMAAVWGAGNETMRLAAGAAHGSVFQEAAIMVVAYSSAPTGITSFALILWGLRIADAHPQGG